MSLMGKQPINAVLKVHNLGDEAGHWDLADGTSHRRDRPPRIKIPIRKLSAQCVVRQHGAVTISQQG